MSKEYEPDYIEEKKAAPYDGLATGQSATSMGPLKYLATRVTTLKPPMAKVDNPIKLLRTLNRQQWAFFGIAFCAWTWDGTYIALWYLYATNIVKLSISSVYHLLLETSQRPLERQTPTSHGTFTLPNAE